MKKTLIALSLVALPVASMADVVLYGNIKGGVEVSKIRRIDQNATTSGTVTNLVDYGSYIGFKGEEQLNGSLKAIWQVEQKVDIAGGAYSGGNGNGFGTQDSFVGLAGDFGTVKAGYQQTPVQELSGKLDVWNYDDAGFATTALTDPDNYPPAAAGLGMFNRGDDARARYVAVTYETPNFNGFSGKVFVSPSDNNSDKFGSTTNANGAPVVTAKTVDAAIYGLSASYTQPNGGFFADLAGTYVRNGQNSAFLRTGLDDDGYRALAQVGYDAQNWMVGAAYQRTADLDYLTSSARSNEVALTGTFNVDQALRLKASAAYGFGFKDINGNKQWNNGKYYQGIVGADYALSKRTVANGQVGYIKIGNSDNRLSYGAVSVGVSHKF